MNTVPSIIERRGRVSFPAHTGERVYMQPFTKREGLPANLRRWQLTVDQMLDGVDVDGPIYLMVDQKRVAAGTTHRREGLHVDGNWVPSLHGHGHSGGHVHAPIGGHRHSGGHSHPPRGGHRHSSHSHYKYRPEAIILASDVLGARAYAGEFSGKVGPGGECDEIDSSTLRAIDMGPFYVWAGNVTMVHEAVTLPQDTLRTVVRLNVPGWEPSLN